MMRVKPMMRILTMQMMTKRVKNQLLPVRWKQKRRQQRCLDDDERQSPWIECGQEREAKDREATSTDAVELVQASRLIRGQLPVEFWR